MGQVCLEVDVLAAVCDYIRDYTAREGFPPTIRELAQGLGRSSQTVMCCLGVLEAQGRLVRVPGKARGLRLLPAGGW